MQSHRKEYRQVLLRNHIKAVKVKGERYDYKEKMDMPRQSPLEQHDFLSDPHFNCILTYALQFPFKINNKEI